MPLLHLGLGLTFHSPSATQHQDPISPCTTLLPPDVPPKTHATPRIPPGRRAIFTNASLSKQVFQRILNQPRRSHNRSNLPERTRTLDARRRRGSFRDPCRISSGRATITSPFCRWVASSPRRAKTLASLQAFRATRGGICRGPDIPAQSGCDFS